MTSNQTNRFQSLDSSEEEFIDGQENENTKKKTKNELLCSGSVPRISCFQRRDETNGRIDSSRAEQVSQRVRYRMLPETHNGLKRVTRVQCS